MGKTVLVSVVFFFFFWCSVICSTYLRGQVGTALCPGCEVSVVILVACFFSLEVLDGKQLDTDECLSSFK